MYNLRFIYFFILFGFVSPEDENLINNYIDLQNLKKMNEDWQVTYFDIDNKKGIIELHHDKWLMYFLHWRPLKEDKMDLSIPYVRNLMSNFWGESINFKLNGVEGEIKINGHKGYYIDGTFRGGGIYSRFIVWNCPETNRQFVADCNINLRRGTSEELLFVQQKITKTVCCHKKEFIDTIYEFYQKYESKKLDLSFFIPQNCRTNDFPYEEWYPEGINKNSGSLWTLLTDSQKHIVLLWSEEKEEVSNGLFSEFLDRINYIYNTSKNSTRMVNFKLDSLKKMDDIFLGIGTYQIEQKYSEVHRIYDFKFRSLLWKRETQAYLLLASLINLKEFWGIKNDLSPATTTFDRYFKSQVIPSIKVLDFSNK